WELRRRLRQEQARPLLTCLCQWFQEERGRVLPKSPLSEAITYAQNQWPAFTRYLEAGWLDIGNNSAERALRGVAGGRANWLFAGSDRGGQTAAVLYSLTQTCARLGIDPFAYLRDLLSRGPGHPAERVAEWLPDWWAQAQRRATASPP